MKIYHFYHIWADGNWQIPVSEHLEYLKKSNILDVATLKIGLVGKIENRDAVKDFIKSYNIKFDICAEKELGYEEVTIDSIVDLEDDDAYILYMHSKGSFNDVAYEHHWRRNMTETLVLQWNYCLDLLKDHYLVGFDYTLKKDFINNTVPVTFSINGSVNKPNGTINSNFWWSCLRYLKPLGKASDYKILDDNHERAKPVLWLSKMFSGEDKNLSIYSLYNNNLNYDNYTIEQTNSKTFEELIREQMTINGLSLEWQMHVFFPKSNIWPKNTVISIEALSLNKYKNVWDIDPKFSKLFDCKTDDIYKEFYEYGQD